MFVAVNSLNHQLKHVESSSDSITTQFVSSEIIRVKGGTLVKQLLKSIVFSYSLIFFHKLSKKLKNLIFSEAKVTFYLIASLLQPEIKMTF